MIVAMQEAASEEQIQHVIERLISMGFEVHRSTGERQTVLGAVGERHEFDIRDIEVLPGVGEVHRISSPYKLVARTFRPEGTVVKFANGVTIGDEKVVIMAGPCSVESREQIFAVAESVSGRAIPRREVARRLGDPPVLVADPSRAAERFGWRAQRSDLQTIIATAFAWPKRFGHRSP